MTGNPITFDYRTINREEEYACKAAKNADEAQNLIESGFEFMCDMEDVRLFRKRK